MVYLMSPLCKTILCLFIGFCLCVSLSNSSESAKRSSNLLWNLSNSVREKLQQETDKPYKRTNDIDIISNNSLVSAKNNGQPPLFWSYYKNAARVLDKVSVEQGISLWISLPPIWYSIICQKTLNKWFWIIFSYRISRVICSRFS